LLAVSRYVVLNPVRAGMVKQMRQWRWSSYRATAGLCAASPFLTTDWLLRQFGAKRDKAQQAYRRFIREGIGEASPWTDLVGGFLLGGEDFAARCRALILRDATFEDVTRAERSAGRPTLDTLFGDVAVADRVARNARIVQAYLEYGYTMRAIADFLDLHYTSISVIVQHGENKTL